jgi:hypothetical protein
VARLVPELVQVQVRALVPEPVQEMEQVRGPVRVFVRHRPQAHRHHHLRTRRARRRKQS